MPNSVASARFLPNPRQRNVTVGCVESDAARWVSRRHAEQAIPSATLTRNLEPGFKVVIIAFMKATYTIGSLAKAARIPTSTVRYYERRGLLEPQSRSHANYRVYDEQAVRRLHFVRSAQAAGFTLSDIAVLLRFRDGDAAPCRKVQDLITTRLKVVARQIEQLRGVDGMLHGWLRVCRRTEKSGRCGLLEGLADSANSCCQLPRMPS